MRVLDVPRGRRIERHQVLGGVDQLAVQRPVVVAADLAAGGDRRVRRDAPPGQSGAVQHVIVTAPDDDHRMIRRNRVEVARQQQALLGELRLVPVGVRDHDSSGCGRAHRRRDGRQHLGSVRAPDRSTPAPPQAEWKWFSVLSVAGNRVFLHRHRPVSLTPRQQNLWVSSGSGRAPSA